MEAVFDPKRRKGNKSEEIFRCEASEGLTVYPLLRLWVLVFVLPHVGVAFLDVSTGAVPCFRVWRYLDLIQGQVNPDRRHGFSTRTLKGDIDSRIEGFFPYGEWLKLAIAPSSPRLKLAIAPSSPRLNLELNLIVPIISYMLEQGTKTLKIWTSHWLSFLSWRFAGNKSWARRGKAQALQKNIKQLYFSIIIKIIFLLMFK